MDKQEYLFPSTPGSKKIDFPAQALSNAIPTNGYAKKKEPQNNVKVGSNCILNMTLL
jgi:hypothetical protein